jgi:hypothetical protein
LVRLNERVDDLLANAAIAEIDQRRRLFAERATEGHPSICLS